MTIARDVPTSGRRLSALRALPILRGNALAIGTLTLVAFVLQTRWGTNPDTSWLITVCERMLAGERLYSDIYETNPPFSVWLYLPPVALAKAIGATPELLVHAWTYLAALAGLIFAGNIVARAGFPETPALFALAPAFYALLVIYPGSAFTQREHIGVALFLPMLALMGWRLRGGCMPSARLAALAGLSGSVLLLVKPHYALMVLFPALFTCWRRRSLRPIFAIEHWVIGVVCSTYLAIVLLVHPEFIGDVYPVLADTYLRIRKFLPILVVYGPAWSFLVFLAWRLWATDRVPELASVSLIASFAGTFPLVWQGKGWAYHAYPALFCAISALLCLLALPAGARRGSRGLWRPTILMQPSGPVVLMAIVASFVPFWGTQKPSAEVVAAIRSSVERPTVAMIGADISNGHPLNRMVDGRWVSTHVSDWLGAMALYLSLRAGLDGDDSEAARYASIAGAYAAEKRTELLLRRPDIIAVDKNDGFWVGYLEGSHDFDAVFAGYHLLVEDDEIRILLRNKGDSSASAD